MENGSSELQKGPFTPSLLDLPIEESKLDSDKGTSRQSSHRSKAGVNDSRTINDLYSLTYSERLELVKKCIEGLNQKQFETVQQKPLPNSYRSLGVFWLN